MNTERYPFFRLPVIIAKSPVISPMPPGDYGGNVVTVDPALIIGSILALLLLIPESALGSVRRAAKKTGNLGSVVKARTKALYYMADRGSGIKRISRDKALAAVRKGKKIGKGPFRLWAVYAYSADDARSMIKRGVPRVQLGDLAGRTANCVVWLPRYSEKSGGEVWRCLVYAPVCEPPYCIPSPDVPKKKALSSLAGLGSLAGALKTCVTFQTVTDRNGNPIERCKRYEPTCTTKACLPEPMGKPAWMPIKRNIDKEATALAQAMAQQQNELEKEAGPTLAREILSRGGIRPYRKGDLREEYADIPLHLKNKRGLPMDEMASEMGIDERELSMQIAHTYRSTEKVKRKFTAEDFADEAYRIVIADRETEPGFEGAGELFTDLRRELVLTADDPATSEDLLVACLQRKGWKPKRIVELQASISDKMTPDMFTGKKGKLTGGEKQLQDDMDRCFTPGKTKSATRRQMALFGGLGAAEKWIAKMDLKKGAFKRQAKRAGMETQEFADYVLQNPDEFTRRTISRARLAKTFKRMSEGAYSVPLAGDIMTCGEWQIKGKPGSEYYRCFRYVPTCVPPPKPAPKPRKAGKPEAVKPEFDKQEKLVLKTLGKGKMHINDIQKITGMPQYILGSVLVSLEVRGYVHRQSANVFVRSTPRQKKPGPPQKPAKAGRFPPEERRHYQPQKGVMKITKNATKSLLDWSKRKDEDVLGHRFDSAKDRWMTVYADMTRSPASLDVPIFYTDKVLGRLLNGTGVSKRILVTEGEHTDEAWQFVVQNMTIPVEAGLISKRGGPPEVRLDTISLPRSEVQRVIEQKGLWAADKDWMFGKEFRWSDGMLKLRDVMEGKYAELEPFELSEFSHSVEYGSGPKVGYFLYGSQDEAARRLKELKKGRSLAARTGKVEKFGLEIGRLVR